MSDERLMLQKQLRITPKTALLLVKLGYHDYRHLRDASPNKIVLGLQKLPGMTQKLAKGYATPMRRLVWLGTQDKPEEHPKVCTNWTQKGLKKRGIWRDGYDDLTGKMVDDMIKETSKPVPKS